MNVNVTADVWSCNFMHYQQIVMLVMNSAIQNILTFCLGGAGFSTQTEKKN